ncbi:MAG TPA: FAD-dependent oxidoreductase [Solirubrobacteraceae bacterium]
MAGIQFYLRRKVDITRGHMTFLDSPWALTALTQGQFWGRRDFARDYGDGSAVDCLSVDISDWDTNGMLYGKPAKQCTREEIAAEVMAQIRTHHTAGDQLTGDIVHSWFLDPGIAWVKGRRENRNDTPLLVNTVGTWEKRPQAHTEVPNLFLAGDYVQTDIDLATMEGGNESGRAAVAALLHASGSTAEPPRTYQLYEAPELAAAKAVDAQRYRDGQPNALDVG